MKYLLPFALLLPLASHAADADFSLQIKDHRFQPAEIKVPSGKKVRLLAQNLDATPEEFDSHDLNREKIIAGHGSATIYVGPLSPGRYVFIGEFHADTAHGAIIAE